MSGNDEFKCKWQLDRESKLHPWLGQIDPNWRKISEPEHIGTVYRNIKQGKQANSYPRMKRNENTQRKPTAAPFSACSWVGIKPSASLFKLTFTVTIRFTVSEDIEVELKESPDFVQLTAWHCTTFFVFFFSRAPEHFIYSEQQTGNIVFSEWAAKGETLYCPPIPPPPYPFPYSLLHLLHVILRTGDAGRLGDQWRSRGQHTDQQQ